MSGQFIGSVLSSLSTSNVFEMLEESHVHSTFSELYIQYWLLLASVDKEFVFIRNCAITVQVAQVTVSNSLTMALVPYRTNQNCSYSQW